MSWVSVPDFIDELINTAANCKDPNPTEANAKPVQEPDACRIGDERRSETVEPKIKIEPDIETEAQLTASIAKLEAALEAKVSATNTSVSRETYAQPTAINAASTTSTAGAAAKVSSTKATSSGFNGQSVARVPTPAATTSAQSGAQRTATHNDNRFHPYQAPVQPAEAGPAQAESVEDQPVKYRMHRFVYKHYHGLSIKSIGDKGRLTESRDHVIIENCTIKIKPTIFQPDIKITARNCQFLDFGVAPEFKGKYSFTAKDCIFYQVNRFKANENFKASRCDFWSHDVDSRMNLSRTVWDNCQDCEFLGEVYIDKRSAAWNGVVVGNNNRLWEDGLRGG